MHHNHTNSLTERFFAKVRCSGPDDCWLWQGYTDIYGYGRIRDNVKRIFAHRLSYQIHVGPIPDEMHVLHRCDTPACVNPSHLFLGTHAENMTDMGKKNRARGKVAHGSDNASAILTESSVVEMRRLYHEGVPVRELSQRFGVSLATADCAVHRRSWKHVT
jgi:hypothetical protein